MAAPTQVSTRQIEIELKKRVAGYPPVAWGRKQADAWDRQTNFIYHVLPWAELQAHLAGLEKPVADYAIHRWFNFWSAYAVEKIFCALPGVEPHLTPRDRLVDFALHGIKFDHKTSVFPQKYDQSARFAWQNKAHLITWLYHNQSREQRYHTANRLFIILYAKNGHHWELRAEIEALQQVIERYVAKFNPAQLTTVNLAPQPALADLIWYVQ